MNKCKVCNSRKGKRKCFQDGHQICSECCGTTRTELLCTGCSYYSAPARRYQDVPAYTAMEMERSNILNVISYSIESTIGHFDASNGKKLNDLIPIKIYELLLDKYYFKIEDTKFDNDLIAAGYALVDEAIVNDLSSVETTTLTKVLAILRFIAKRRTTGRREYLEIVQQYAMNGDTHGVKLPNE